MVKQHPVLYTVIFHKRHKLIEEQKALTLQLETATIFEIVCKPFGRSPAKTGLAG